MELKEVDPGMIEVDKANERQAGSADREFIENVKQTGVIQPPIVRGLDGDGVAEAMGAEYSVVVGGRRVDAAAMADLDTIPVLVVDWDDGEALVSSIIENIDAFRKEVNEDSRALAAQRAMELNGWNRTELAEALGVSPTWVRQWLEPLHSDWEDTEFHAKAERDDDPPGEQTQTTEQPRIKKQKMVRSFTGGGGEGERVMKRIQEEGLSLHDVEEVKQSVDRGKDVDEAIEEVKQEATEKREGGIKVSTRVVFTGDYATAVQRAATDRSASDEQIVRTAVTQWLESEGYL